MALNRHRHNNVTSHSNKIEVVKPLRIRRNRISIDIQLEQMFKLLAQGYTDTEMKTMLNVPERTYYNHKLLLYKKYGTLQREKSEDVVYYQQMLLAERLTKLYRYCELKLQKDLGHMNGNEFAALASVSQELAVNLLRLEAEGLRATNRSLNRIVKPLTDNSGDVSTNTNNNESQDSSYS